MNKNEEAIAYSYSDSWNEKLMKRYELYPGKRRIHYDNASVHHVLRVCEFLAKDSIAKNEKKDHQPHSTEHKSSDFSLLLVKNVL